MKTLFLLFIVFSGVASAQSTMSDAHTPIIDPPAGGGCNCKEITNGITAGPLKLSFKAKPSTSTPDAGGYCYYAANDAGVALTMDGQIQREVKAENKVKVSFGRDCQTKALTAVKVDWEGDLTIPELFVKTPGVKESIKVFDLAVKKMDLTVSVDGKLSGSVTIRVTNPDDRDLTWNKKVVMLRKGTNANITFLFNNTNGWAGSFDFSGIKNINIDLCKQDDKGKELILASFKDGSLDKDGTLTGKFVLEGDNTPSYTSNLFRVTLLYLKLGLELKIPDASFRLTDGTGKVRIADMKHVTGTLDLGLVFPGDGTCKASVEASNLSAFTMTLSELKVTADFDQNFDMREFWGSLKAKHNKFDVAIDVSQIWVRTGTLKTFECGGSVKYSSFSFVLEGGKYEDEPAPKITIKKTSVKIDATGTKADLEVKAFTIAEDGKVTVGSIAGNLDRAPAKISFLAEFKDNEFYGTFDGELAKIGLNGKVDIGAKPDYNFAYLEIEAKNDVGIPIGQSGLKLTSVGGRVGYNYFMEDIDKKGEPKKDSYLVGLSIGIADIANMVGVKGTTVVQFGNGQFVVDLKGNVAVLQNNKFFDGTCKVKYKYPDETLSGSVGSKLNIPGSGWVLKSDNLNIDFSFANKKFSAEGNKMSGKMFADKIELSDGNFSLGGDLKNANSLKGKMGGKASCSFSYALSTSAFYTDFSGDISLKMNSAIAVGFDQTGMTGGFDVTVNGDGSVRVKNAIFDKSVKGSATCNGSVTYNTGTLTLTGNMDVALPISFPVWYPNDPWYSPSWTNQFSTGQVSISF